MAGAGLLGASRAATGFAAGGSTATVAPLPPSAAGGAVVAGLRGAAVPRNGTASYGFESLRGFAAALGVAACAAGVAARRGQ
eukprot:CAMPEP_0115269180 /NCGR_PEP_ID=MMETSP0270-20121206/52908_1 /TAXON_ID=71861 /ORGANISM="Scrippsiella trochoidea, Strain CCMP3099" /LENGTH=81 /DNA_ID=CAMNT_0002685415 /DNA_START=18 /DNA_END=260 /DNA_ORIENTATION=-